MCVNEILFGQLNVSLIGHLASNLKLQHKEQHARSPEGRNELRLLQPHHCRLHRRRRFTASPKTFLIVSKHNLDVVRGILTCIISLIY